MVHVLHAYTRCSTKTGPRAHRLADGAGCVRSARELIIDAMCHLAQSLESPAGQNTNILAELVAKVTSGGHMLVKELAAFLVQANEIAWVKVGGLSALPVRGSSKQAGGQHCRLCVDASVLQGIAQSLSVGAVYALGAQGLEAPWALQRWTVLTRASTRSQWPRSCAPARPWHATQSSPRTGLSTSWP